MKGKPLRRPELTDAILTRSAVWDLDSDKVELVSLSDHEKSDTLLQEGESVFRVRLPFVWSRHEFATTEGFRGQRFYRDEVKAAAEALGARKVIIPIWAGHRDNELHGGPIAEAVKRFAHRRQEALERKNGLGASVGKDIWSKFREALRSGFELVEYYLGSEQAGGMPTFRRQIQANDHELAARNIKVAGELGHSLGALSLSQEIASPETSSEAEDRPRILLDMVYGPGDWDQSPRISRRASHWLLKRFPSVSIKTIMEASRDFKDTVTERPEMLHDRNVALFQMGGLVYTPVEPLKYPDAWLSAEYPHEGHYPEFWSPETHQDILTKTTQFVRERANQRDPVTA